MTTTSNPGPAPQVHPIIEAYRALVDTLAGYMQRAAELLEKLYAEQDQVIDQLRQLCAQTHSLRRADFDAIFGQVLADRQATRQSLAALVGQYRAGREAVIQELEQVFRHDAAQAFQAWPALKQRLLNEEDDGTGPTVTTLRRVHVAQEMVARALAGLLERGDKLKVEDLKMVARRLAGRESPDAAELAGLLAVCESAGGNVDLKWRRLVA
jgi:hypothetical protein